MTYVKRVATEWGGDAPDCCYEREDVEMLIRRVVEDCLAQINAATDHAEAVARIRSLLSDGGGTKGDP